MDIDVEFEEYLRFELRRSEDTVEAYIRDLKQFIDFIAPEKAATGASVWRASAGDDMKSGNPSAFDPERIKAADIRAWLASKAADGLKPRSLRRKTESLRAFFRFIMITRGLKANPALDVTLAKLSSPLPDFVPAGEMETLLNNPEEKGDDFRAALDHVVITMFYTTGIRRAELLSLTDGSIDFGKKELKVTGKRNKTRIIPLGDSLVAELHSWQALRDKTVKERKPADRLFCGRNGTLSEFSLAGIVKRSLAPTSARKKSPHILRHTFATALLNGGAEINSVKELLGHSSLSTTQIYTHLSFDELKKSYSSAHPRVRMQSSKPESGHQNEAVEKKVDK